MRAKLIQLYLELQSSYWFVPMVMVVLAIVMAFATTAADTRVGVDWLGDVDGLFLNQPAGARALLSTIAGSMITVAGVTFSMTIVSVAFAASQFGPRLTGNFMRDTGNQITLGTFIATFVYCLLILRTVRGAGEGDAATGLGDPSGVFVPHISIFFALVAALASVAVLIYFIHHIPETIDIAKITAQVGSELTRKVESVFPDDVGTEGRGRDDRSNEILSPGFRDNAAPVRANESGYIVTVDGDGLLAVAKEHDLILRLERRPGDFVTRGKTVVWADPAKNVTDEVAGKLRAAFAWGPQRTPAQNLLFLVDELVEIMGRALSPSLNDPFTAINCIDWLQRGLAIASRRPTPSAYRYDEEGCLRVIAHPVDFRTLCGAVFEQSRQYVAADRNTALHMLHMIGELVVDLPDGDERDVLLEHADSLNDAAQDSLTLELDRREVAERHASLRRSLVASRETPPGS